jgi:hypothetical protein
MKALGWGEPELLRALKASGSRNPRGKPWPQSTVNRYLNDAKELPASFVAACEEAGLGNARYLLTGEGSPDLSVAEAETMVEEVRKIVSPRASATPHGVDEQADFEPKGKKPKGAQRRA